MNRSVNQKVAAALTALALSSTPVASFAADVPSTPSTPTASSVTTPSPSNPTPSPSNPTPATPTNPATLTAVQALPEGTVFKPDTLLKDFTVNIKSPKGIKSSNFGLEPTASATEVSLDNQKVTLSADTLHQGLNKIELSFTDHDDVVTKLPVEFIYIADAPTFSNTNMNCTLVPNTTSCVSKEAVHLRGTVSSPDNRQHILTKVFATINTQQVEIPVEVNGSFDYTIPSGTTISRIWADNGAYTADLPFSTLISGYSATTVTIYSSATAPVINVPNAITDVQPDKKGIRWFASEPGNLTFTVTDDTPMTVDFKVNGEAIQPTTPGTYTIPARYTADQKTANISITATDIAGNVSEFTTTLRTSAAAPTMSASAVTAGVEVDAEGVYSKSDIQVQLTPSRVDGEIKYATTSPATTVSSTGLVTLSNGAKNPEITVTDHMGRVQTVKLAELLHWTNAEVNVNSKAPEITFDKTPDSIDGKWLSSINEVPTSATAEGTIRLRSATVAVDGKVTEGTISQKSGQGSFTPPSDEGTHTITMKVVDRAGNVTERTFTYKVDKTAPEVTEFELVNPSYAPGKTLNGSDEYGLFVQGATKVRVHATDAGSGVKSATLTYLSPSGTVTSTDTQEFNGGYAEFDIPAGFKGYISATATDAVGNVSTSNKPDGIVSTDSNTRVTPNDLGIEVSSKEYVDGIVAGTRLYKDSISATLTASVPHAGIRSISWGYGDTVLGDSLDNVEVTAHDKNLTTGIKIPVTLSQEIGATTLWVKVVDNAGNEAVQSIPFAVDATVPTMDVSYSPAVSNEGYYNQAVTATITAHDNYLSPESLALLGDNGAIERQTNDGQGAWTYVVRFADNKTYTPSYTVTDAVGHSVQSNQANTFTVDTVAPVANVSWNVSTPSNGNYYRVQRVATITVVEENFDPSLIHVTTSGSMGGWSSNGNVHTLNVSFGEGTHTLSVSGADKAGNTFAEQSTPEFIVDTTAPQLTITGLSQGTAYYKDLSATLAYSDTNADINTVTASIVGKKGTHFDLPLRWNGSTTALPLDVIPDDAQYDDLYTLLVKGTDLAGNETTQRIEFIVNRYGSTLDVSSVDYRGKYLKEAEDVNLVEQSVEKLNLDDIEIRVSLDGESQKFDPANLTTSAEESDGSNTYHYNISKNAFPSEGTYVVQVTSKSAGGRENVSRLSYAFVIDSTKPDVSVSQISSGSSHRTVRQPFTVLTRDMTKTEVTAFVNDKPLTLLHREDGSFEGELTQSTDNQTVVIKAVDQAGNETVQTISDVYVNDSIFAQLWYNHKTALIVGILTLGAIPLFAFVLRRQTRRHK